MPDPGTPRDIDFEAIGCAAVFIVGIICFTIYHLAKLGVFNG